MVKYDKSLICIFLMDLLASSSFAIIPPLLTTVLKFSDLNEEFFGYIFCMYGVALIMFYPIFLYLLTQYSRRSLLLLGLVLNLISMLLFMIIGFIDGKGMLFLISIVARFTQGIAIAAHKAAIYSIYTTFYKDNQKFVECLLRISTGLGMASSPILGT
jgi:MFS family permease